MATATCQLSEDQFLCSICLDVFTDPVTLPCGHNFCRSCIDQDWAVEATCKCPYCKQSHEILLVSLASFCQSHLEPHLMIGSLRGHKLVPPQRTLECEVEEAPSRTSAETQEIIAARQHTVQQLRRLMELNNKDANAEIAQSVQAFTALKDCVQKDLDIVVQEITRKRKTTEDNAKGFIEELEQEMSVLRTDGTATATRNWSNLNIRKPTYEGTAVRAMAQLDQKLGLQMKGAFLADLQRVRKYSVYVMIDPDKVHPKSTNQTKSGSDSRPECKCVLASQCFSTGKCYFEVDVKSKSKWVLGLAKELHVDRVVALSPRNAYWAISMRNKSEWYAGSEPSMRLALKSKLEKVGVFLDYEEGLVSFYDADQAGLIYTFTGCNFTHKVHPFFSPCQNDGAQLHTQPDSSCVLQ